MENPAKKNRLEAQTPHSPERGEIRHIIEHHDVGGGVTLSMTLGEFSRKVIPSECMTHPFVQQHFNSSMKSILSFSESAALASSLFCSNWEYALLKTASESVSQLLGGGIGTIGDWAARGPPHVNGIIKNMLDAAALDAGLEVHQEGGGAWTMQGVGGERELPRNGADATELYAAIKSATCESYTVTTRGANGDREVSGRRMKPPQAAIGDWQPTEALRVLTLAGTDTGCSWPCDRFSEDRRLCVRRGDERTFCQLFGRIGDTDSNTYLLERNAYVIGSPGVGKTYFSCTLLWRLLNTDVYIPLIHDRDPPGKYDVSRSRQLRYIQYTVFRRVYLFDKETGTAVECDYREQNRAVDRAFITAAKKCGCIRLFDCCEGRDFPEMDAVPTILLLKVNESLRCEATHRSRGWVGVWSMDELCAWAACVGLDWPTVKKRAEKVGGIPRFLCTEQAYSTWKR